MTQNADEEEKKGEATVKELKIECFESLVTLHIKVVEDGEDHSSEEEKESGSQETDD